MTGMRACRALALAGGFLAASCAEAPPPSVQAGDPAGEPGSGGASGDAGADPADRTDGVSRGNLPRGAGFLDQGDVTIRMAGEDGLIVDVLPLNAEVISLASDDLRVYLQEALKKVPDTVPSDLQRDGTFFLVGFSATQKEIPFEPSLVQIDSEGRRYYPRYIVPVSAGFEAKILRLLAAPVWAVYIYEPGIDLVSTLEFGYGEDLSTGGAWRRVVERVEEARSRAAR